MKRLLLLLAASVVTLTVEADAQTIQSFGRSRCSDGGSPATQYWLTGFAMIGPRLQARAQGYSVQVTGMITSDVLADADLFVTGLLQSGSALAPGEAADLEAWVRAGGGLLYIGDNDAQAPSNAQFAALFSLATYAGQVNGSFGVTIVAPGHPLILGPAGTVSTVDNIAFAGSWTGVSSAATVIATNPNGSAAVIAADYGAGRVVLVNDANYFCNPFTYESDKPILWENTIDWLSNGACPVRARSYCTAGTTSSGCQATMGARGAASLSNATPFTLTCTNLEGNRNGIFFYGVSGRVASAWGIGGKTWLCVKSPAQRMNPLLSSGGSAGTCTGSFSADWNAYVAANPNKSINQALIIGNVVTCQAWFRDPASGTGPVGAKGTALSDGLEFMVCP